MWSIEPKREHSRAQLRPAGKSRRATIVWGLSGAAATVLAALLILYRRDIGVGTILRYAPKNLYLAALVFMGLFVLKSLSVVFDMKLIYIAAGLYFPLPAALAVNIAGTVAEAAIPYLEGRLGGTGALQALLEKWPKLQKIQTLRVRNNYLFALLLRAVGFLPADPLGMYFGASGMPYGPCMLGCVTGMLPVIAVTTVMGGSIEQPGSLAFILSTSLFAAIEIGAVIAFAVWAKKKPEKKEGPV